MAMVRSLDIIGAPRRNPHISSDARVQVPLQEPAMDLATFGSSR